MAYLLRRTAANNATAAVNIANNINFMRSGGAGFTGNFELEFEVQMLGTSFPFISQDILDGQRLLIFTNSTTLEIRRPAGTISWTLPTAATSRSIYRIVANSGSNTLELFQNNVSLGTRSGADLIVVKALFGFGSNVRAFDFYYLKLFNNGVLAHNYDPSASNGTGTTLIDTVGGNNGTLVNFPSDNSQWVFYEDGGVAEQRSSTFTSTASASASFAGEKTEVETKSSSFASSQGSTSTLSGSALELSTGVFESANNQASFLGGFKTEQVEGQGNFTSSQTSESEISGYAVEFVSSTITSLSSAGASFQGSAREVVSALFNSLNEAVATFSGSALELTASSFSSSQQATAGFSGFKTEQGVSSGTIASLNISSSSLIGAKAATAGFSSVHESLASFSGSKVEQEVSGGVIQSLQTTTSSFSGFKTEQEVTGGVIQSLQSAVAVFEGFKTENESRNGSLTSLQGATSSFSGSKGVTVQISSNNASEVDLEGFKTASTDLVSNVVGSSNFRGYNAALPPAKLDIFLDTSSNLSFILDTVTPELNFGTNQNMYLVVNSSSQLEVQL